MKPVSTQPLFPDNEAAVRASSPVMVVRGTRAPDDADAARRRALLDKLVDDRSDLKRLAGSVRSFAHTVDTAQRTLALTRQSLHWLLLAGSAVSLGLWLSNVRRSKTTLLAGISMQVLGRWLEPPAPDTPSAPARRRVMSTVSRARSS